ncbi:UNVERIFIED_CONTAM: hypothetical protein RMT77_003309 [Armadillidium vulgare]
MAKIRAASEMLRGAASKECLSISTPHPIITLELAASDDGDGAAMTRRPACPIQSFISLISATFAIFFCFPLSSTISLLLNLISCS